MKAEHTFRLPDLTAFAELSGDYNPLHTDPIAARRTQFGNCVAHGVLVLLWALNEYHQQSGSRQKWARVNARFLRPILADVKITATSEVKSEDQSSIAVMEGARTMLQCDVTWQAEGAHASQLPPETHAPPQEQPARIQSSGAKSVHGTLPLHWPKEIGTKLFPTLASTQDPASIASLLASTRVVGMKVPGEHSIFLQLDLSFGSFPDASTLFAFRVAEFRPSSQRLGIAIEGNGCKGILWALFRPAPVDQPDMATVKQRVAQNCFAGRRVIVIGGSRGLGETAAKLLAAGGAEVALSYRTGRSDAERVVADIKAYGGKATAFHFDTGESDWESQLSDECRGFDHLCYFPTPPLTEGDGISLNQTLFKRFFEVYAKSLVDVGAWLEKQTHGQFALFTASTVAVEAPPLRHLEYAAAKGAAEVCCRWIAMAHPKARIHIARFPRLLTDQTVSFLSTGDDDNLTTVLRELSAWISD